MNNERPTWEEFWFTLTLFYATRGTCDRLRTACILVGENNRIISAGYNGSLPGGDHCDDVGHFMVDGHCIRTLHAEENALLNAAGDIRGATAYILDSPCIACSKKLISKGVKRILFTREYKNVEDEGRRFIVEMAQKSGVELRHVDMPFDVSVEKMLAISHDKGGRLAEQNTSQQPVAPKLENALRIERISPFAKLPVREHADDAGLDLFSAEDARIMPKAQVTVGTGIKIAIPSGHAGFVWDKSGIAAKHNIKILGGVLDSNYRGELKIIMHNLGAGPYEVRRGEKVAQLVVEPIAYPPIVEERLPEDTDRGAGGFGSTGLL